MQYVVSKRYIANYVFDQVIQNRLKESIEDIIQGNALNSKMPVLGAIPGTIETKRGTVNNNSSEFLLLVHPYYWSNPLSGSPLNEIFAYFRKIKTF